MDLGNHKVLTRKSSSVNMQTGEIIEREESVILKAKKRERFMLLYVENFTAIVGLTKKSQQILAQVLAKKVTFGTNEVVLDSVFRAELANDLRSSRQVINNCIVELVDKKILKREKRAGGHLYFLNPHLFGNGEWNTILKQRQQFTIDYDFANYTAEKEIKTITAYDGLPDKENIQVIKRESYKSDDGIEKEDVLIEDKGLKKPNLEKDNTVIDAEIEYEQNVGGKSEELTLLREKNREKELNIRELELKVKMQELDLKRIQGSLFE